MYILFTGVGNRTSCKVKNAKKDFQYFSVIFISHFFIHSRSDWNLLFLFSYFWTYDLKIPS